MHHQEEQQLSPSLPLISRLDRLDRLLMLLEERQWLSSRHSSNPMTKELTVKTEEQFKTLSSALEEVDRKGTLIERLTMLENRVLELSLEMEVGNASRSSSSATKTEHKSSLPTVSTGQHENRINNNPQVSPTWVEACECECEIRSKGCQKDRRMRSMRYKKWVGWFRLGC